MNKKIALLLFLLLFCIFINTSQAKYVIEEKTIAATIKIDRTPPSIEISFSTKEATAENVEVTIKANENIQAVEGWTLQEDKVTLKKTYNENMQEEIIVKDVAGNITKAMVDVNNIDKEAPTVQIEKITNFNSLYPNYANKETKIIIDITMKDNKKITKALQEKDLQIWINNKQIMPNKKEIAWQKNTDMEKKIKVILLGIEEEGELIVKIPENTLQDEAKNGNKLLEKSTAIQIDNTKPNGVYSQEKITDGKIQAQITANEEIRPLEGWNLENKKILKKIFNNNLSYTTTIQDLAGNASQVNVNVTGASNIVLSYASHNSEIGWSYGYGNYDIAGLEAIKQNAKYKTESLAFNLIGNVENDYLQVRAYVHTYWGEGRRANCGITGKTYYHGWNPQNGIWAYENTQNSIQLNGKNYFQLGGAGVNGSATEDIDKKEKIPLELVNQYPYGISALQMQLKSYEENAICYQVYVDEAGWLRPAKNGEITSYKITKPISAIRVALVPNSELNALLNTWEQDTRKKGNVKEKY